MSGDELRIVVVDDMPELADSLAEFLRLNGHTVHTAYGGKDALVLIDAFRPHCVLLDITMPEMSGGELARELRRRHGDALVLIAITGRTDLDVVLSPELRDLDYCMRKPVQMDELAKMLPLPLVASGKPANTSRIAG